MVQKTVVHACNVVHMGRNLVTVLMPKKAKNCIAVSLGV